MLPLLRFLEIAATNLRLTSAGYLPPRIVRELAGEFDWWQWDKQPQSEVHVPQIITLREFASLAGLTRTAGGRVTLTKVGRDAVSDPAALWERVAGILAAGEDFAAAIREALLVQLLKGPAARGVIAAEVVPVLTEAGWKPSDGSDLDEHMLFSRLWDAIRSMDLLGMIETGDWPEREMRLTEFGFVSASAILWHRSTAPMRSIM